MGEASVLPAPARFLHPLLFVSLGTSVFFHEESNRGTEMGSLYMSQCFINMGTGMEPQPLGWPDLQQAIGRGPA